MGIKDIEAAGLRDLGSRKLSFRLAAITVVTILEFALIIFIMGFPIFGILFTIIDLVARICFLAALSGTKKLFYMQNPVSS